MLRFVSFALVLFVLLGACGGSVVSSSTIGIRVEASPIRIRAGKTALLGVAATREDASATIDVVVSGLPAGVTAKPAQIAPGTKRTDVELTADKSVERGARSAIQVTAESDGLSATTVAELQIASRAGELDESFGREGISDVLTRALADKGCFGQARSIAIAPDGRITVGLSAWNDADRLQHMALARLAADGALDPTFGDGGVAIFGDAQSFLYGHVLLSDGEILAYGNQQFGSSYRIVLARLSPDGVLDTSFGGTPKPGMKRVMPDIDESPPPHDPSLADEIMAAVLQKVEGREYLLVVGDHGTDANPVGYTSRLTLDGEYDRTFNAGHPLEWKDVNVFTSVVTAPEGAAYMVGSTPASKIVARILSDGARDDGFGLQAFSPLVSRDIGAIGISSGWPGASIVAAGEATAVSRFGVDGKRDPSFVASYPPEQGALAGMTITKRDEVLVLSTSATAPSSPGAGFIVLARLRSDGATDPEFGDRGATKVPFSAAVRGGALILDAEGRTVVVADDVSPSVKVLRFWN